MKLLKSTIHIGIEKPFTFLHMTDTHLHYNDDGSDHYRKRDFNHDYAGCCVEYFLEACRYARENNLPVLHTGDLWDFISDGNFQAAKQALSQIDCIYAMGNHELYYDVDDDYHVKIAAVEQVAPQLPNDLYFYSSVIHGVNFVTLDNASYQITETQLDLLNAEVAKGLPIILGVHIPFCTPRLAEERFKLYPCTHCIAPPEAILARYSDPYRQEQAANETTRKVAAYIKAESMIKAVIAGHTHCNFEEDLCPGKPQFVTHGTYHGYVREITIR